MAIKSQVVTVGTTATLLSFPPGDTYVGSSVALQNTGGATVKIGGPDVTASSGWSLAPGVPISLDLGSVGLDNATHLPVDEQLYGVVASGSSTVEVLGAGV